MFYFFIIFIDFAYVVRNVVIVGVLASSGCTLDINLIKIYQPEPKTSIGQDIGPELEDYNLFNHYDELMKPKIPDSPKIPKVPGIPYNQKKNKPKSNNDIYCFIR